VAELELSLVNVVVNARDAIGESGQISITAQNITLPPEKTHEGRGGDFVSISITDNGSGIPEQILPRIFEPFFTTKKQEHGTGLGLPKVYGFARQSGGNVDISSKLGHGTTVTMYLPRSWKAVAADEAALVAKPAEKEKTVLLVEDNAEVS